MFPIYDNPQHVPRLLAEKCLISPLFFYFVLYVFQPETQSHLHITSNSEKRKSNLAEMQILLQRAAPTRQLAIRVSDTASNALFGAAGSL